VRLHGGLTLLLALVMVGLGIAIVIRTIVDGGGSVGAWQRAYFPAVDFKNKYRLVVATPSAATKEPALKSVAS